jgi:glutamate--cysteine ligase
LKDEVSDGVPNLGDWNNHLTTLFPDVRLKRYLEMRGADGGPWRDICALPALWIGLLYDKDTLAGAEALTGEWSIDMVRELRDAVPREGLNATIGNRKLNDAAREALALAANGLHARGHQNQEGFDDSVFLAPLNETVAIGQTPAEGLLQRYYGPWLGDVRRLFDEYAY